MKDGIGRSTAGEGDVRTTKELRRVSGVGTSVINSRNSIVLGSGIDRNTGSSRITGKRHSVGGGNVHGGCIGITRRQGG